MVLLKYKALRVEKEKKPEGSRFPFVAWFNAGLTLEKIVVCYNAHS
jgi:hypothetical protein